jgi:mono/diheme cytochrome c family protein
MAEEWGCRARMTDADLNSVAIYLKDQPSEDGKPAALTPTDPAMRLGQIIYANQCSACHTPTGSGIEGLFPALAGAPAVQA